jgi:hypothetical protein
MELCDFSLHDYIERKQRSTEESVDPKLLLGQIVVWLLSPWIAEETEFFVNYFVSFLLKFYF